MKKFISLTLSLIMIMTTLCALPFSAKADAITEVNFTTVNMPVQVGKVMTYKDCFTSDVDELGLNYSQYPKYQWKMGDQSFNDNEYSAIKGKVYELFLNVTSGIYQNSFDKVTKVKIDGVELANANGRADWNSTSILATESAFDVNTDGQDLSLHLFYYYLEVEGGSGSGYYLAGQPVNIQADNVKGKHFVNWEGSEVADSKSKSTTVNMPKSSNAFVRANLATCTPDTGTVTKEATYTAAGEKTYKCTVCGEVLKTEPIAKLEKKANTIKVKGKTITVKAKTLKKKNQAFAVKKAMTVSKAQGTVTYTLSTAKKGKKNFKSKFAVNKKNGKLTVKKGTKKGTYTLKIKVKAAGNKNYKAATKTVTVKVKVK